MRENLYPKLQSIYKTTSDTFVAVADFEFFLKIFLNFYSSVNAWNRDGRSVLFSAWELFILKNILQSIKEYSAAYFVERATVKLRVHLLLAIFNISVSYPRANRHILLWRDSHWSTKALEWNNEPVVSIKPTLFSWISVQPVLTPIRLVTILLFLYRVPAPNALLCFM